MKIEFKIGINHPDKKEWHNYWIKITIRRKEYDTWIFLTKHWAGYHHVASNWLQSTRKDYGFIEIVTLKNNPGNQLDCIKKDTHQDLIDSMAYAVRTSKER